MNKPSFKPAGWRVLIDPDYNKVVDFGGGKLFEIVETDRTGIAAVTKGQVVAMGDVCYKAARYGDTPWCKLGDIVVYAKYGGTIIEDPETKRKYVIINDEDVIGVANERGN